MAKRQGHQREGAVHRPNATARRSIATTTGRCGWHRCGADALESLEDDMDELLRPPVDAVHDLLAELHRTS
jgi:hypothetical protein